MQADGRSADVDEQRVLARWSSWGALPEIFDEAKANWSTEREQLQQLLTADEYTEARRTTINAHYTDPAYVAQMWSALGRLGFTGGEVLEPGAGAGTFIGLAPEQAHVTGVELDSTTAAIAAALYPHATIRAESFADTRFPRGHFDAAVGNVPFAKVALHDPTFNAGNHAIHNHFIIKSLELTRPGGMVAVLTSHFTLDSKNPAARREMNAMADLVGAVRLPSGAHRRSAGTEAVTDLLIFRKRESNTGPESRVWETVAPRMIDGEKVSINNYFDARPAHILGELHVDVGMYGAETLHVRGDLTRTPALLEDALTEITDEAIEAGWTMTARSAASQQQRAAYVPAEANQWDGTIVPHVGNSFTIVRGGAQHPLPVPKAHARELRSMLELRDAASALLAAEAATVEDTAEITRARSELREKYAAYKVAYGPLNRFTLRPTGRVDAEGEPTMARMTPRAAVILRQDPFGPLVMALEQFDETTQTSKPAAILSQRVVVQRAVARGAETPAEAIALSLDRTGRIDLGVIADLLGQDVADTRASLGELVYDDPTTERLLHAPEYLSGDVRKKLDAARAAAETDERYNVNVTALEAIIPPALSIDQIEARLGAVWINAETHEQFLKDILRDQSARVENPVAGMWTVKGNRGSVLAQGEWGTARRPATDLVQSLMEQKPVTVYDEYENNGKNVRVLNAEETTAAQEKAQRLQERFSEWVWEDHTRANALAAEYNRRFNSIVLRDYSNAGDYLTLPGMAANFVPLPHQRDAVARGVGEPAVGLFHEVGAGKTAEMVMIASELKRMGLVSKPAIVVPNHMLEQFGREWLQVYPQARILAASSDDLSGDKRRLFIARAAANDWDGIIMTQSAFERVPVSPDAQKAYIDGEVDELRRALDSATDESAMSIKRIERTVLAMEEKQKKLADKPRDHGISFEASGIDYLLIDEAHSYKNLATSSNIPDANIAGSQRASDLHMKLEYLRSRHGERVVTAATATPLSNSITEAYVMQRFLRPDLLKAAGIGSFDAWAATFGETVTDMEMAPTGNGNFRLKTRFAKFQNVPEMLRMWHVFADVKTAEDLNLPVPLVRARADGKRLVETIVIPPTREIEEYISAIGDRAEAVANRSVTPAEDNMLKISTDGRKASVDVRLVRDVEPTGYTMIDAAADTIAKEWRASRDIEYLDVVTREPSPVRGGLQLAFLDLGTPNPDKWNAYDELKLQLVQRGVPAESIRYIHEAKTDADKARIFAAARAGHISVLVGSTTKMGVGTNVQARISALHDLDSPWRPGDLRQRHGRGIRQGNQNAEIGMFRYVVERSFAAYMWQTVERKAKFIAQLTRSSFDVRELEDIGDDAMSAAEAKALSSGNPLLLEKATVDNELAKLQRLERAHRRNQLNLNRTRDDAFTRIESLDMQGRQLENVLPRVFDTSGEKFTMTIGRDVFDDRVKAGHAIAAWANASSIRYLHEATHRDLGVLGKVSGFDVSARVAPGAFGRPTVQLNLVDVPRTTIEIPRDIFLDGGVGLVRQIENRAASVPKLMAEVKTEIAAARQTIVDADASLAAPFKYESALETTRAAAADVDKRLAAVLEAQSQGKRSEPSAAEPIAASLAEKLKTVVDNARDERNVEGPISRAAPERRQGPSL